MLRIIQNDPEVPPGNLLDHLGVPYRICRPYRGEALPETGDTSALIVLGGAMGANDDVRHPFLVGLKNLIREAVEARIPYLGICLGGQLLATALGAQVVSNRWEECGTLTVSLTGEGKSDPLFHGIAHDFGTFQWHHDSFDLPDGAVLLAFSAGCPHQAFRVGSCAWGLQFHPEVTERIVRDWCAWDDRTADAADVLVTAFSRVGNDYRLTARRLCENFVRMSGVANRSQDE